MISIVSVIRRSSHNSDMMCRFTTRVNIQRWRLMSASTCRYRLNTIISSSCIGYGNNRLREQFNEMLLIILQLTRDSRDLFLVLPRYPLKVLKYPPCMSEKSNESWNVRYMIFGVLNFDVPNFFWSLYNILFSSEWEKIDNSSLLLFSIIFYYIKYLLQTFCNIIGIQRQNIDYTYVTRSTYK